MRLSKPILTSLRLMLETGTVRILLREPRASVQTSSTKTPTSCVNVQQFSLSSRRSCPKKRGFRFCTHSQHHENTDSECL